MFSLLFPSSILAILCINAAAFPFGSDSPVLLLFSAGPLSWPPRKREYFELITQIECFVTFDSRPPSNSRSLRLGLGAPGRRRGQKYARFLPLTMLKRMKLCSERLRWSSLRCAGSALGRSRRLSGQRLTFGGKAKQQREQLPKSLRINASKRRKLQLEFISCIRK